MAYRPKPVDTSDVNLTADLSELIERLAENSHDHWALKRISEGWSLGPSRDDTKKTHPDLVSYGELSESEKDYDRKTVVETLKMILALGYDVKRKG